MFTTPAPPEITRRSSEPSTQQGTLGSLEGEKGQLLFPGFVVLVTIFLVVIVTCILWSRKKQKKRRVPYLQVTPSLALPPPRQRAKNIYDFLPRQQTELGRHQLSGFSTESLLSRASDSPEPEVPQASGSLQKHRASVHAVEYTVGVYDNGTVAQMCGPLASSAHLVCDGTSRSNSISSKESNDYVNIPTAEDTSETLTCTKSTPENHLGLPRAQQLEFAEGGHAGCGNATDRTGVLAPGLQSSNSLSDGDNSSQSSNDYVNMTGLDLEDIQESRPRVAFQCCRDYENVPPVVANESQLQTVEEVTSSTTDRGEPAQRTLSSVYHMAFRPSAWSEDSAMIPGEEESNGDSSDYENVLVPELEGKDWKQGPGTWHPSDEGTPGDQAGTFCEAVYPAGSLATETSGEEV